MAESEVLTRDNVVTIAKGMCRDPDTDDTKSRFTVANYINWTKESYIHHLSILPLPLLRVARQLANFTFPAGPSYCTLFSPVRFTYCGDTACSELTYRDCLRLIDVSWGVKDCTLFGDTQEYQRAEESSYFKATVNRPSCLLSGRQFHVAPASNATKQGFLHYISRPTKAMLADNFSLMLELECAYLVAKYVACRKFLVDGDTTVYTLLYKEYQTELKALIARYSVAAEVK